MMEIPDVPMLSNSRSQYLPPVMPSLFPVSSRFVVEVGWLWNPRVWLEFELLRGEVHDDEHD